MNELKDLLNELRSELKTYVGLNIDLPMSNISEEYTVLYLNLLEL